MIGIISSRSLALIVLCAVLVPATLLAQSAGIYYVYDTLNRLVGVVDQDGNAAMYSYDAVGNIVRIARFDATAQPGAVAISMFAPAAGPTGTTVEVFGRGFGATLGHSSLFFAGRAAEIVAASPNRLVAKVPAAATTGPISVAAPLGTATSARAFRVLGQLAVTPAATTVRVSDHATFVATEAGSSVSTVRWSVNGLPGGEQIIGTITADGVYTAPGTVPVPPTVTITATHQDDATLTASASVSIIPPLALLVWARPLSVAAAAPALSSDRSVGAAVSVVRSAAGSTFALSTPLSVAIEPVVVAMTPSTAAAGTPTFSLRIVGRGLAGATALSFLRNNAPDPSLTATSVVANADGTEATADITIAATAASGARVVQIATNGRTSTPAGTGGNVFAVQ